MNRFHGALLLAPALVWFTLSTGCTKDMSTISPEARTAVETKYPNASFQEVESEWGGLYEIELTDNGASREVKVRKDGTIIEIETKIDVADLPKPVADTVAEKVGGRPLREVQKVELPAEQEIYYEVEWTAGGLNRKIEVNPDGTVR